MRDLDGMRPVAQAPAEAQVIPKSQPPTFFERLLGGANRVGGKVAGVEQPVVEAIRPHPVVKPKRRMPRGVATKAGRAIKKAAHSAKDELKKPGRKTALVHTVALGALFAVVLNGTPWLSRTASDSPNTQTVGAVRRYLPSIPNDARLEPFNASAALSNSSQKLGLYGWITPWNLSSASADLYNGVSAFWLTVGTDALTMTPKADWAGWNQYKSQHTLNEAYLTVSGDPNVTSLVLSNLDLQSQHIKALLTTVRDQAFDGIDIDYEGLGSSNRELFTGFIRNLANVFHQAGKKVAVTLEARIANQVPMDWRAIGELSDEVRIMAYDYHAHQTATPGPIAPLAWVSEVTAYAIDRIAPSKLIIGLGNYGYDWTAPVNEGDSWQGTGISYDQAVTLSKDKSAPVIQQTGIDERGYDIGTAPSFTYTDTQGQLHQVWFEDATSLQEKLDLVSGYQAKGVMFWSVGAGDPALWQSQT